MTEARRDIAAIARAFVRARLAGTALDSYPGVVPVDLDEAYDIQAAATSAWHDTVAGWKVGYIPPFQEALLGANRLVGPIFRRSIHLDTEGMTDAPVFAGGFAAVEAEFVAVLGDGPGWNKTRFTLDDAAALIDRLYCGIEIAGSPLSTINALGAAVTVSDFGNNAGLIVGPEVLGWREHTYARWPVSMEIDGVQVGEGVGGALLDGPVGAVRFLLETAVERGLSVGPGTLVSTGALSGVHNIGIGAVATARFGDFAQIRCRTVEARPASAWG